MIKEVHKKIEEFKKRYSQALKRVSVIPKSERKSRFKVDRVGAFFDTQGVEKRARVIFDEFGLNLKRLNENLNLDSVEKFSQETDEYIMELDAYIVALNTVFNRLNLENKDGNENKKTDRVVKKNKKVGFNLNPEYSN